MNDTNARKLIPFPSKLLTSAMILTGVLLIGMVWSVYETYRWVDRAQQRDLRINALQGVINYLDEVLTMSARLAATTGNLSWEQRYRQHEAPLDEAVKEAIRLTAETGSDRAAEQTDAANLSLVEMEHRSFTLVHAGRYDEAKAVLFGAEYEAQKRIYAEGMTRLMAQLKAQLTASQTHKRRVAAVLGVIVAASIVLLLCTWLKVMSRLHHWRTSQQESFAQLVWAEEELRAAHDFLEKRVEERTHQLNQANAEMERSNADLETANAKLHEQMTQREKLQRQVVEASRQAGKAEIATGVLHNVGNVLNSINVSATVLQEHLGDGKVNNVRRVADLLAQHAPDLPAFFNTDRGRQVPKFLADLAGYLEDHRDGAAAEVDRLIERINHIKHVVSSQQAMARNHVVHDMVQPADVFEEALHIQLSTMQKNGIEVVRLFEPVPPIMTDRHAVLQVLINLLSNACKALRHSNRADKRITIRLAGVRAKGRPMIYMEVIDNGVGIEPEQLTRIFTFGYTGWEGGHGFGLHGAANTAKQLQGEVSAASEGRGCGARFRLELPVNQKIEGAAA